MYPTFNTEAPDGMWFIIVKDDTNKCFSISGPLGSEDKLFKKVLEHNKIHSRQLTAGSSYPGKIYAEQVRREAVDVLKGYTFVDSVFADERFEISVTPKPLNWELVRKSKNAAELKAALDLAVQSDGGRLDGHQWLRIVPADPETNGGANWTVMHSGEAGGFSKAIDRAQARLKTLYELSGEA